MKDAEFRDGKVVRINKRTGESTVWGTIKNWNRLPDYAKRIGIPEDQVILSYDACMKGAKIFNRSTDFESLFNDVKVIMELHMQTTIAVFALADELNMDSREVFAEYGEAMMSKEGKAAAAKYQYTISHPQLIINEVIDITRKQIQAKVPR